MSKHVCFPFIFIALLTAIPSFACTAFRYTDASKTTVGWAYDWISEPAWISVNQRGVAKRAIAFEGETPLRWTSRKGSLTFSGVGTEFAITGMNEDGLVVGALWLEGSRYPVMRARESLSELQWVQYQLDNFGTIAELIRHLADYRISQILAPLHFLACERAGKCAAIEFLNGVPLVTRGRDFRLPLLSNHSYRESLNHLKGYRRQHAGLIAPLPTIPAVATPPDITARDSSHQRFTAAALLLERSGRTGTAIEHSLNVLNALRIPGYTMWNIVFDLTDKEVTFRTATYGALKRIRLGDLIFTGNRAKVLRIDRPFKKSDIVMDDFSDYSPEVQQSAVRGTLSGFVAEIRGGEDTLRRLAEYPGTTTNGGESLPSDRKDSALPR